MLPDGSALDAYRYIPSVMELELDCYPKCEKPSLSDYFSFCLCPPPLLCV